VVELAMGFFGDLEAPSSTSNYDASGIALTQSVVTPEVGYDLGAEFYDDWKWQKIWQSVEWPYVERILRAISISDGLAAFLDLGVGTGAYLEKVVKIFEPSGAYGIDVSRRMLAIASAKLKTKASLVLGDARSTVFPDAAFDAVLLSRVASHMSNIYPLADEITRMLHPGGHLIVTDVHAEHPYNFTRIPFEWGKISIDTYKHSLHDWHRVADIFDWTVETQKIIVTSEILRSGIDVLPSTVARTAPHPVSFVLHVRTKRTRRATAVRKPFAFDFVGHGDVHSSGIYL
jgi:ubiquinone/menaquinone biosynthesis C-methylase UbiE